MSDYFDKNRTWVVIADKDAEITRLRDELAKAEARAENERLGFLAIIRQAEIDKSAAEARAVDYTWFWQIVDAEGLNNVASDEQTALRELVTRATAAEAGAVEAEHQLAAAREALKRWQHYGCPDCGGDCGSANPPVNSCIMQETRAALSDAPAPEQKAQPMNDDQIKLMAERFLGWKLPEDFNPDGGVTFERTYRGYDGADVERQPTGTNLFTYTQAVAMVRYMLTALSDAPAPVSEITLIEQMLDEGQGDDDGPPILPKFEPGMSVVAKVESCLHLLEKRRDVIAAMEGADWRDDPSADERWNAGCDYAMTQLCAVLKVDPQSVNWDAATETLDGDVQAVLHGILAARAALEAAKKERK